MPRPLIIDAGIQIPATEITLTFARSAGPGGQNVNKVNSKAVLRWNARTTTRLPPPVKSRFLERYAHRITQAGEIVFGQRPAPRAVTERCRELRKTSAIDTGCFDCPAHSPGVAPHTRFDRTPLKKHVALFPEKTTSPAELECR